MTDAHMIPSGPAGSASRVLFVIYAIIEGLYFWMKD